MFGIRKRRERRAFNRRWRELELRRLEIEIELKKAQISELLVKGR